MSDDRIRNHPSFHVPLVLMLLLMWDTCVCSDHIVAILLNQGKIVSVNQDKILNVNQKKGCCSQDLTVSGRYIEMLQKLKRDSVKGNGWIHLMCHQMREAEEKGDENAVNDEKAVKNDENAVKEDIHWRLEHTGKGREVVIVLVGNGEKEKIAYLMAWKDKRRKKVWLDWDEEKGEEIGKLDDEIEVMVEQMKPSSVQHRMSDDEYQVVKVLVTGVGTS